MSRFLHKELVIYILWIVFGLMYFDRHSAQFDELLMLDILGTTEINSLLYILTSIEIQMPLSYFMSYLMSELFIDQLWVMRIPSLLFTLLTPIPLFFWAKEKLGTEGGKMVSFVWMFSYSTLYYFYSIRPYSALMFLFACFLYFFEKQSNKRNESSITTICLAILICLVHPVGVLIVALTLLWSLFYCPGKYPRAFVITALISLFLLVAGFLLARGDDFTFLMMKGDYQSSAKIFYDSSGFVLSGTAFALYFLFFFILALVKKPKKLVNYRSYNLFVFLCTGAVFILLELLTPVSIGPRHFIIFVPFVSLILVRSIMAVTTTSSTIKVFSYLGLICLMYKSFFLEEIVQVPPNLNSADLAAKVFSFSAFNEPVISCGNCPSYYIPDQRLSCLSRMQDFDEASAKDYFVFIEYSHESEQCSSEVLGAEYIVTRQEYVRGASIKYFEKR